MPEKSLACCFFVTGLAWADIRTLFPGKLQNKAKTADTGPNAGKIGKGNPCHCSDIIFDKLQHLFQVVGTGCHLHYLVGLLNTNGIAFPQPINWVSVPQTGSTVDCRLLFISFKG
nr:hypothetical protein [uncultured Draconibacterium sp.]